MFTLCLPTWKPLYRFSCLAFFNKPFRPSTTTLNKKGAKGSPCLIPLLGMNSADGLPFIRIEMEADFKHPSIHLTHLGQKPVLCSMYSKKSQDTESYAYSKSTLNTRHDLLSLFSSSSSSKSVKKKSHFAILVFILRVFLFSL